MASTATINSPSSHAGLRNAWLALSIALGAHVADEALTGFLPLYNAVVSSLRARYAWYPMPTFTFRSWFAGLATGVALMLLVTPAAARNARWWRPIAYILAVIMLLNGLGHTLATIFGRVAETTIPRPAPGFYSSPLLLIAGTYLLVQLRRTRSL